MRGRSETIGQLGRAPARSTRPVSISPTPPPPSKPSPPPTGNEPGAIRAWLRGALFDNLGLKFLSLVLALTVSLLVNTDKDREITAHVGVSYSSLPDDKVLVSDRLEEVHITVRGPLRRLRRFDERELDRINLDLRHQASGEIEITPDMVHLPAGLTVGTISPHSVRVAFDRRVEKTVDVSPSMTGQPSHGFLVSDVKAIPPTVKVRGAETTLAALSSLKTHDIPLADRSNSFTTETQLVLPDGVELLGPGTIGVTARIDEQLVTRHYGELPVTLTVTAAGKDSIDPAKWTITPARVDVTLTGALLAVEQARDSLTAVVTVAADSKAREADVVIAGLPAGVGVRISPARVKLAPIAK